jgi:two-component system repressor protein LuxO
VLLLAQHFLSRFAREEGKSFRGLDPETEDVFLSFNWPGNVRQLQNVLRNVVVLHNAERITVGMLPPPLNAGLLGKEARWVPAPARDTGLSRPPDSTSLKPLWLVEKEAIERAIDHCGGNIPRAAVLLEVSPSTIYRKRQAWSSEGD